MVDVTVVIPCYNVEAYLEQCLTTVCQNDRVSLEILCINDGSKDGSLKIMQKMAKKDSRIRVIDKKNQGYGATVNRGFNEAQGAYLAVMEPDDYLKPHMYDDLIDLAWSFIPQEKKDALASGSAESEAELLAKAGPDIVKSAYWRVTDPLTPRERILHCVYWNRIHPPQQPFTIKDAPRLLRHHPSIWSALYRKDFINNHKIRFKEVPGAGWVDNPFLVQTLCQAKSIVYTDKAYYCYRENLPGSSSTAKNVWKLSLERWNDMENILDELDIQDSGVREAMDTVLFRYTGAIVAGGGLEDPTYSRSFRKTLARLRPSCVANINHIRPSYRALFLKEGGLTIPRMSYSRHVKALGNEFVYAWRSNGFKFALESVRVFRHRVKERSL